MPLPSFVHTFRDAELSLWQAAVNHELGDADVAAASNSTPEAFLRAATQVGAAVEALRSLAKRDPIDDILPTKPTLAAADLPSPQAVLGNFLKFGMLVIALTRRMGDDPNVFMALLKTRYGNLDPRWADAALRYFIFVKLGNNGIPGYKPYQSLTDFVIDGKLRDKARVALIGDWGTGTQEAEDVLVKLAAKKPDVVIHLGDVYYAGAPKQFAIFQQQFQDILSYDKPGGPLVFTLSGNHDMYSGGGPYYETIEKFGQPASYFCLRNANWQFVAMDTGFTNSEIKLNLDPDVPDNPHGIQEKEAIWVRDKVANAGGRRTILLSHHQPFSAFEKLSDKGPVNTELLNQMRPVLGGVCRWYWGHEHDLVVYSNLQKYQGVLGRCLGHGAIPMDSITYRLEDFRPEEKTGLPIPDLEQAYELDEMTAQPGFYNHGYVIIDLEGPAGTATHYQSPDPEKQFLAIEQLS